MTDERRQELIDMAVEKAVKNYTPTQVTTKDALCVLAGCVLGVGVSCCFEYSAINRRLKKLEKESKCKSKQFERNGESYDDK